MPETSTWSPMPGLGVKLILHISVHLDQKANEGEEYIFFAFGSCARLWQCEKRADNCLQISPFVWQPLLLRNNFNDRHCWWVFATMSRPLGMLALGLETKLKIFWLNIEQTWCGKCGAEGWKGIRCYVVEKSTMISEDGLRFKPKSTITGSCEYNSWENHFVLISLFNKTGKEENVGILNLTKDMAWQRNMYEYVVWAMKSLSMAIGQCRFKKCFLINFNY